MRTHLHPTDVQRRAPCTGVFGMCPGRARKRTADTRVKHPVVKNETLFLRLRIRLKCTFYSSTITCTFLHPAANSGGSSARISAAVTDHFARASPRRRFFISLQSLPSLTSKSISVQAEGFSEIAARPTWQFEPRQQMYLSNAHDAHCRRTTMRQCFRPDET